MQLLLVWRQGNHGRELRVAQELTCAAHNVLPAWAVTKVTIVKHAQVLFSAPR
jgi:hypothetical protein